MANKPPDESDPEYVHKYIRVRVLNEEANVTRRRIVEIDGDIAKLVKRRDMQMQSLGATLHQIRQNEEPG